jgi:hypothetical protein
VSLNLSHSWQWWRVNTRDGEGSVLEEGSVLGGMVGRVSTRGGEGSVLEGWWRS